MMTENMVMSAISIGQLLVIALIVVVLFGTNKLRTMGSDLGAALKGFKKAMGDDDTATPENSYKSENSNKQPSIQQDADFKNPPLEQSAQMKTETDEVKRQDKTQI